VEHSARGACCAAERVFFAQSSPDESARPPHDPPLVALVNATVNPQLFAAE